MGRAVNILLCWELNALYFMWESLALHCAAECVFVQFCFIIRSSLFLHVNLTRPKVHEELKIRSTENCHSPKFLLCKKEGKIPIKVYMIS